MSDREGMISRLKNRTSPKLVPPRDTSLADNVSVDMLPPEATSTEPTVSVPSKDIPASKVELPEIADRRQIRLEQTLNDEILALCDSNRITVETYLEALHLACKTNAAQQQEVIAVAKTRLKARKQAGKIRRIKTQYQQISE